MNKMFASAFWTIGSQQGVAGYIFDYKKPFSNEEDLQEIKEIIINKIKDDHVEFRAYESKDMIITLLNWRRMESAE